MFEDCTANLNLEIFAMCLWTVGTQEKLAIQLTGCSKLTIIMVYGFLRVMCWRYLKNNLINLGGEGVVCQVDESMFAYIPHHQLEARNQEMGIQFCGYNLYSRK
jgi:hypothetical protein